MAFNNSHHINVNNVYAWDHSRSGGESAFSLLQKAACIGVSHSSDERFDSPRCHPDTRKAVLNDILSWINLKDPKERIMWLSGPAGVGKSAIAQTIAERCDEEHKLISSFFFSRTDTGIGRDDGTRLIPTIAYQMAVAIPQTKELIIAELERDPAVLEYSKEKQMKRLIVEPLMHVQTMLIKEDHTHVLVIIDGLDECDGTEVQSILIKVIAGIFTHQPTVDLWFLIASRPELEIRKAFALPHIRKLCARITLDEHYRPKDDIRIYLQSEFDAIKRTHPLAYSDLSDTSWPSSEDLNVLVNRSSGQFIYASTVIKFLINDRHDPRERLHTIINTSTVESLEDSPYIQLDALYTHILSYAVAKARSYKIIKQMFEALIYLNPGLSFNTPPDLAEFLHIKESTLYLQLLDLHSVIHVPSLDSEESDIRFFHASFKDYLIDCARSKEFYIVEAETHVTFGHCCLANILDCPTELTPVQIYASRRYFYHLHSSGFDDRLLNELKGKNIQLATSSIFMHEEDLIDHSLSYLLKYNYFNFDFGSPVTEKIKDICGYILPAVDEFIIARFKPSFESYFIPLLDIVRKYRGIHKWIWFDEILKFWPALLMESPSRGKGLFLNDKKSQEVFYIILERSISNVKNTIYPKHVHHSQTKCIGCGVPPDIYRKYLQYFSCNPDENWMPAILTYLLARIEPSVSFGVYLAETKPKWTKLLDLYEGCHIITAQKGYQEFSYNDITVEKVLEDIKILKTSLYHYLQACSSLKTE